MSSISRFLEVHTKWLSSTNWIELTEVPVFPSRNTPSDCDVQVFPSRSQIAWPLPPSESKTQDRICSEAGSQPIHCTTCFDSPPARVTSYSETRYCSSSAQRHLRLTVAFSPVYDHWPTSQENCLSGSAVSSGFSEGDKSWTLLNCQRSPFLTQTDR